MENPLISIIIPVIEPLYLIEGCINSIFNNTLYKNFEIIIINNSESDINYLKTEHDNIIIYNPQENLLHAESIRMGLCFSKGEYILLLNDDIEIPKEQPRWLNRMLEMFTSYPACGISTIVLIHADNTIYCAGTGWDSHPNMNKKFDFAQRSPLEIPWSNMACALTKKKYFNIVRWGEGECYGVENLKHYGDDHAWSLALAQKLNLKNIICRDTWIYHYNERGIEQHRRKNPNFITTDKMKNIMRSLSEELNNIRKSLKKY